MANTPIEFKLLEINLFERPMVLRMPFRFGVVTLTTCPQAFVQVKIQCTSGQIHEGVSAETMAPKWFDKNLALSNEDNFNQLRHVLLLARQAYLANDMRTTAFELFSCIHEAHLAQCAHLGYNSLLSNYGPALIDRAILDAVCRSAQISFYTAIQNNAIGIAGRTPVFEKYFNALDMGQFLNHLHPSDHIEARHTVGLVDPITSSEISVPVHDGLPESLDQVVAHYKHRFYKVKVMGDLAKDMDRMKAIASVLDQLPNAYFVSLDGNEQYQSVEQIAELLTHMRQTSQLQRFVSSILFIEQPIERKSAFSSDVRHSALNLPVIIDESDDGLDSFLLAKEKGYAGISSKSCKGIYKSILNAARCLRWNQLDPSFKYFMTAEDLTTQAGVSVQQDLALVNILGIQHVERNGHHYVNGMKALSNEEQVRFLQSHGDLYERTHGAVRLKISNGRIQLKSLSCEGFATQAQPDFRGMNPMIFKQPTEIHQ